MPKLRITAIVIITTLSLLIFTNSFAEKDALDLSAAIELALKNNPNIDAMVKAVQQAEYLRLAAFKEYLPVLSTEYSFTGFSKKPALKFNKEEVEELNISEDKLELPLHERTSFLWSTHIKMPIYTGGALELQESIARLGIDVAKMRLLEAKVDLIQEVTINYFNALRAKDYLELAKENLQRLREHERTTDKFYKSGMLAKNTLLEVKVRSSRAKEELISASRNLKLSEAALNASMGTDINAKFQLKKIYALKKIQYSLDDCYTIAKNNNPSLLAFDYLKKRAQEAMELEKTETRPKVSLDVNFTRYGKTAQVKGDDHLSNNILAAMLVLDWNIFDWFKSRDRAEARIMELEMIKASQRSSESRINLDIKESYLDIKTSQYKLKVARQEVEYAKENYRINKRRYAEQIAPLREAMDALVLLKQAEFNYYDALYTYNLAFTKLERVIGTAAQAYLVKDKRRN